ncbi:HNH endonuclease signature motif containing protein [uncultured Pseudokineococcus sp.]|uniref:HNH endonuclease signature motif containing protein n=1 Tax=uncultured Pseudokineococcus sp. TaxID=1642928 RepID=UPI00260CF4D9|nr:HNH endonuclease signature motif containing protein [uncultured Pseudokineococcus sp.]
MEATDGERAPSEDGPPGATDPARDRARALVDGMVVGQAERARSWAGTLRAVADLVDALSAPDGLAGPLSGGAEVTSALTATGGARAGSPAAARARHRARQRARAQVVRAHATGDPVEAAVAEVALAMRLTTAAAAHLVDQALALTTDLTATYAALAAGTTDEARAKVVVDGTAHLPAASARRVDALLQPAELAGLTTAELRARVRHLAAVVEPAEQAARSREGVCARGVRLLPLGDGLAELRATGPALDLACAFDALTGAARNRSGPHGRTDPHAAQAAGVDPLVVDPASLPDRRGVDARRFDALVDVLVRPPAGVAEPGATAGRATDEDAGAAGGRPAADDDADDHSAERTGAHGGRCHGPQVVVAMTSLLGLDDEPAQLAGVGPVPAAHLAEHLRHHPFRRAFTDPATGRLVALDGHLLRVSGGAGRRTTATVPLPGLQRLLAEGSPADAGAASGGPAPSGPASIGPSDGGARDCGPAASDPPPDTSPPDVPEPSTPPTTSGPPGRRRGAPARPRPACPVAAAGGGPYTPSAATQRHLRATRTRCAFPGCRVPAERCDLDHVEPYATGGPTCPCNLHPLCRRHHLAKHRFGWRVQRPAGGGGPTRWTSPLGQTATTRAEPLLPPAIPAASGAPAAGGSSGSETARPTEATYPAHDAGADDARWARSCVARDREELEEGERRQEERRQGERQQEDGGDPRPDGLRAEPAPPDSWGGGDPPF